VSHLALQQTSLLLIPTSPLLFTPCPAELMSSTVAIAPLELEPKYEVIVCPKGDQVVRDIQGMPDCSDPGLFDPLKPTMKSVERDSGGLFLMRGDLPHAGPKPRRDPRTGRVLRRVRQHWYFLRPWEAKIRDETYPLELTKNGNPLLRFDYSELDDEDERGPPQPRFMTPEQIEDELPEESDQEDKDQEDQDQDQEDQDQEDQRDQEDPDMDMDD
jgi:hypothetical protein